MAGLVNYDSSEESEVESISTLPATSATIGAVAEKVEESREAKPDVGGGGSVLASPPSQIRSRPEPSQTITKQTTQPTEAPPPPVPQPSYGPQLPPSGGDDDDIANHDDDADGDARPPSPPVGYPFTTVDEFYARRQRIHHATVPRVPNLDLPTVAAAGGEEPEAAASLVTKRMQRFLALKEEGVHFNAKLDTRQTLQNPHITETLLNFVGIGGPWQPHSTNPEAGQDEAAAADSHGLAAYGTTLSTGLWDLSRLPAWAFRSHGSLDRNRHHHQPAVATASADGPPRVLEFVPGSMTAKKNSKKRKRKASAVYANDSNTVKRKSEWD